MEEGQAVEVQCVWAGGSLVPLRSWFKGYTFVRVEGVNAVVKRTEGMYEDIQVRFPVGDVRPAS